MTHPVHLSALAALDIQQAREWHDAQEPGLGDQFLQRVNETMTRIGQNPHQYPTIIEDVRRANLRQFKYGVWYRVWESVVVVPRWSNRTLNSIELHPISLGFGKPRTFRGRPRLADEELGRKIIEDVRRLSAPFGTRIEYRNGIGVVLLEPVSTQGR